MKMSFEPFQFDHGLLSAFNTDGFASALYSWNQEALELQAGGTYFGYVQEGTATLHCKAGEFQLQTGMYFSTPGEATISCGKGIAILRPGYKGFFQIGGAIEDRGRLKYIDGCTDSLLIPPVLKGDPCLNLLYFPQGINQTQHTHPSNRVGLVARGFGECITPHGSTPLFPGQIFIIHANGLHSFRTDDSDMTVIAYHPDSDFGATHEDHPMINRTMVDGISAAKIDEIRTQ
jgi:hypothetical protein